MHQFFVNLEMRIVSEWRVVMYLYDNDSCGTALAQHETLPIPDSFIVVSDLLRLDEAETLAARINAGEDVLVDSDGEYLDFMFASVLF